MNEPQHYEQWAAELDELAAVPTEVLAARLCVGCPVRVECLEFELRLGGAQTLGVFGALNAEDRRALNQVWSSRSRADIAELPEEEGGDER